MNPRAVGVRKLLHFNPKLKPKSKPKQKPNGSQLDQPTAVEKRFAEMTSNVYRDDVYWDEV